MNISGTKAYHARAAHCSEQSHLTKDEKIKKFWEDIADDWLALDNDVLAPKAPYVKVILPR